MKQHERLIMNNDGSQVKIVAQLFSNVALELSIGTFVLFRRSESDNWEYCSERPADGWKQMSREEYIKHGRARQLQVTSIGQILKTANELRQIVNKEMGALARWASDSKRPAYTY